MTISGGTAVAGAANAFSAGSATSVAPGGILDLGTFAETINAVSFAGGMLTNGALAGAVSSTGGIVNARIGAATVTEVSGQRSSTAARGRVQIRLLAVG